MGILHIFLIAAISIDGFISQLKTKHLPSTNWTSKEDKKFFIEKTKGAVCIMGSATYNTIGKPLPKRLTVVYTNSPTKIATQILVLPVKSRVD